MHDTVGAPGATLDVRLLKSASIYNEIIGGSVIPDQKVALGNSGEIPLVAIGDKAFHRISWLLKSYNKKTTNKQEKYLIKKIFGARVVPENADGMLERGMENFI